MSWHRMKMWLKRCALSVFRSDRLHSALPLAQLAVTVEGCAEYDRMASMPRSGPMQALQPDLVDGNNCKTTVRTLHIFSNSWTRFLPGETAPNKTHESRCVGQDVVVHA